MKIGANTIIWDNRVDELPKVLDLLAAYGCEGVEFSQRPERWQWVRATESTAPTTAERDRGFAGKALKPVSESVY